jgi:hypothetical protein
MSADVDFVVGSPGPDRSARAGDDDFRGSVQFGGSDWFDADRPGPRRLPGTPAVRRALAVALTLAAVIAVLLTNRSTTPARPVAQHVPPAPGTAVMGPIGVARPQLTTPQPVRLLLGVPPCPWADDGQALCTTDFSLPPDALAAVRRYFPDVRSLMSVTHVLRETGPGSTHGLWTRTISGRIGPMRLTVTVRMNEAAPLGRGVTTMDGQRYAYCQRRHGTLLVAAVLVSGQSGSGVYAGSVASGRVSALAGDQRLLRV